jgi:hypothetical protein
VIDSGAHPASYPVGTVQGYLPLGGKLTTRLRLVQRLRMHGVILLLPSSSWHDAEAQGRFLYFTFTFLSFLLSFSISFFVYFLCFYTVIHSYRKILQIIILISCAYFSRIRSSLGKFDRCLRKVGFMLNRVMMLHANSKKSLVLSWVQFHCECSCAREPTQFCVPHVDDMT